MYHNHFTNHTYPQPTKYTKMITFTNLSLILVNLSLLSNELANNIAVYSIKYVLKFDICRSTICCQIDCPSNQFYGGYVSLTVNNHSAVTTNPAWFTLERRPSLRELPQIPTNRLAPAAHHRHYIPWTMHTYV